MHCKGKPCRKRKYTHELYLSSVPIQISVKRLCLTLALGRQPLKVSLLTHASCLFRRESHISSSSLVPEVSEEHAAVKAFVSDAAF